MIGDVNIRIGEAQQHLNEIYQNNENILEKRASCDKEINSKGKHFLEFCEDENLFILNGSTKGDENGEFTYMATMGDSVNDICAVSCEILHNIQRFEVVKMPKPDHFPIQLTFQVQSDLTDKPMQLLPKLRWKDKFKDQYQKALTTNLRDLKSVKQEIELKDIEETIKKSSNFPCKIQSFESHQKWFDRECSTARKNVFKKLNVLRKQNTEYNKQSYLEASDLYRKMLYVKRKEYYDEVDQQINNVKTGKDWWNLVKELRQQDINKGSQVSVSEFRNYFQNLLNPPSISNDYQYAHPQITIEELDRDITVDEIKFMLSKVKLNKAPGEDRIPYEFLINATDEVLLELAKIFTTILRTGIPDESFLKSVVFPIFKKGDPNLASNYRGISFMNCISKILMGILNERITNWVNEKEILNEYQAGFRKQYSTVDNVYNLSSIINLKFEEKKKVYAFFVDFKAAFDNISRKALIYKLYNLGLSTRVVKLIESLYTNTKAAVWSGDEFSDFFDTLMGVKQGCLLSPLLFALFLIDMHEELGGGLSILMN